VLPKPDNFKSYRHIAAPLLFAEHWMGPLIARRFSAFRPQARREAGEQKASSYEDETPEERVFLEADTRFFLGLYKDRTTIQADALAAPYIGKWIRVSGAIEDISADTVLNKDIQLVHIIRVRLLTREGDYHADFLSFSQEWKQKITSLGKDSKLTAIGRIREIGPSHLSLRDCEVVD
jgi:hypothetical protein